MRGRYKTPPALKHGGYSAIGILPGEDPAAFEKLRRKLVALLVPTDPFQEILVDDIARLMWRKQNLRTLHIARLVQDRRNELVRQQLPDSPAIMRVFDGRETRLGELSDDELDKVGEATEFANNQIQKEFGDAHKLLGCQMARIDQLMKELSVLERLDSMIERALKRYYCAKTFDGISQASHPAPQRRIAAPKRAAMIKNRANKTKGDPDGSAEAA
jgi:hypothetical protein